MDGNFSFLDLCRECSFFLDFSKFFNVLLLFRACLCFDSLLFAPPQLRALFILRGGY